MTNIDDKTKERALLLMRFYWLEELYNLGKSLNIPYFGQFKAYWEIDYNEGYREAALEIAKVLSDDQLLQIVEGKPPGYGLVELGGFQGNYYSSAVDGKLELKSSWDSVRKNTRSALGKWKDRVYGVLKAIINKGGRTAYFDLIDEIEKVLGYEFVPSYLLPRLGPLKLVFKTGSNKYPDWTMPPEIIPVVQEEVLKYETTPKVTRTVRTPIEKDASAQIIHSERIVKDVVVRVVQVRRNINLLFESYSEVKTILFKQNEPAILDISRLCANEDDFNNRVLSLSGLIGEIDGDVLKSQIRVQHDEFSGSIGLLEAWLELLQPDYDRRIIKNLRVIQTLRSKKYPIHVDTTKFIKALQYFGSVFPVTDWQELWEAVLSAYLQSLEGLEEVLRRLCEQKL
ncbi:hypothetical protein ES703_04237 [subsurface metagenome]